jgi:outer membrane lipoprotein SlyB
MMQTINIVKVALISTLIIYGCASSKSGQVYTRDQTRQAHRVERGAVTEVRTVKIEGTKSAVGSFGGAALGGIGGSMLGGGRGSAVFAVLGAIGGGLAGAAAEEALTRQDGLEITVKLDSGSTIAVVQKADVMFKAGDRVRVLSSSNTTRVTY